MMSSAQRWVWIASLSIAPVLGCGKQAAPSDSQQQLWQVAGSTPTSGSAGTTTSGAPVAPPTGATPSSPGASGTSATATAAAGSGTTSSASTAAGSGTAAATGGVGAAAAGAGAAPSATGTAGTGAAGTSVVATAGASAAAGSGAAGETSAPAIKPPCLKKASQVIVMGDTFVIWAEGFLDALKKESGQAYRNYALEGAGLGSVNMILGPNLIPPEFDQALSTDPNIIAAIMTGGGTDILLPDPDKFPDAGDKCKTDGAPTVEVCQEILKLAFDTGQKLFQKMADSGVKDLVFYFYPHVPKDTVIGGANPNAMLDYANPMAKALCDGTESSTGGKMRCHFLDLVPIFEGHERDWFQPSDVHPNKMGSAAMAQNIVKLMKDKCIAQPEASGCCTP